MRVLLIDANASLANVLRLSLQQNGYVVDVASTAAEGDELAVVESYDVIVMDVMLPDRDGVALCRDLRRQKVATPILMLTVLCTTSDKVAGLDAGADDYMTKPFQLDELLARLRSLLRRAQSIEGAVLHAGNLEMRLHERTVTRDGELLKLSTKEFALLEFMMRNPRRLLTRALISESVWDMNYEARSNVIDVYVSNLRRKIDSGDGPKHIETVIGSGYRFHDDPTLGHVDALAIGKP